MTIEFISNSMYKTWCFSTIWKQQKMIFYRLSKIFNTKRDIVPNHNIYRSVQLFLTLSMSVPIVSVLPQGDIIYDVFIYRRQ